MSQGRHGRHLKAFSSRDGQEIENTVPITPQIFHDRITMTEHPTLKMSRLTSNDVVRQNINMQTAFADDIESYLRDREARPEFDTTDCLERHEIKGPVRARMVDWMIEVLSNFHCDEQTFFIAVQIMDRYFKNCRRSLQVTELHTVGVTSMFVASKYEDIYPLRMKTIDEKIAQRKIPIEDIKTRELEILEAL